ncbi:hypothetical protein DSECCO2_518440 [anaerobic digester metagenome]
MGDEEQSRVLSRPPDETFVVERGYNGLSRPCGGDDEVPVVLAHLPLDLQAFEDLFLVVIGLDVKDRAEIELTPLLPGEGMPQLFPALRGVCDELRVVPVGLKRLLNLPDDIV